MCSVSRTTGRLGVALGIGCLTAIAPAIDFASIHGIVETYLCSSARTAGMVRRGTWTELDLGLGDRFSITSSTINQPRNFLYDEQYVRYTDPTGPTVRAGRFRSSFGFGDWNELFYKGFNFVPIVRAGAIVNNLSLNRQDSGVEVTISNPSLQIQAGLTDSRLSDEQILPNRTDHATVRLQTSISSLIIGGNFYSSLANGHEKAYGIDLRYTVPNLVVRGEAIKGDGNIQWGEGFYVDAAYRIPRLIRTQLLARTEGFRADDDTREYDFHTLGVRQVMSEYLTCSLNYGWGSFLPSAANYLPTRGWSLIALVQFRF